MTLIACAADDRVAAGADARLTRVGLGAGVGVIARRPVGSGRVGAGARRGIAGPGDVALIAGRADDGSAALAVTRLTGIGLGAGIAIAAGRPVRCGRIRTDT